MHQLWQSADGWAGRRILTNLSLIEAVDMSDIGVMKGGCYSCLLHKIALLFRGPNSIDTEKFNCHKTAQAWVARLDDLPHSTFAEFFDQLVMRDGCADKRVWNPPRTWRLQ